MPADRINVYEVINNRIFAMLDAGIVPWRKPWVGGKGGNLPRNISGRPYRGINVWLLSALGYESPYFLTYKQAEKMGGKVKRGEKGMSVVLWKPFEKMVTDPDTGQTQRKRWLTLNYYTVFNVAQTEGCTFPKKVAASLEPNTAPVEVDPFEAIEAADAIFEGYENRPPVFYDGNDRAYYVPATDTIHLPTKAQFRESGEYYGTLFHECAHSTGHADRLGRPQGGTFGSHDYGVEELTAEFTAAYLGGMAGLSPAVLENQAAYISSWKRTIQADPKIVVTAAGRAQKAADYILGVNQAEVEATDEAAA